MMLLLQFLFGFALFIVVSIFLFCIPGSFFLQKIKINDADRLLSVSWVVGLSIFLLVSYVSAAMYVSWMAIVVYVAFYLYVVAKKNKFIFKLPSIQNIDWVSLVIILLGTAVLSSVSIFSGLSTHSGMQFIGYVNRADGLIHVAYIKHLAHQFPPLHIGLSGVSLKGYHFLYDFLLSRFILFFRFNAFDLYYRIFPIFILLLYGASFYSFAHIFSKAVSVRRCVLFVAYFSYSFASLLGVFTKIDPTYGFGLTQVTEFIFNPSIILSISMLLIGGYLLLVKENSYAKAIVIGIIVGLICEMKVYTGFAALSMLGGISLYRLIFKKDQRKFTILSFVIAILLTILTFLPNNTSSVGLIFHPGFMYEHFMGSSFFDAMHWPIRLQIFEDHHNFLHMLLLYAEAFILFWVLSLGVRIVVILGIIRIVKKEFWLDEGNILLLFAIIPPIVVASFFLQTLSLFDTNQFFWISECLLAIPTGYILGNIVKSKKILLIGVFVILLVCVWNAYYQTLITFVIHPLSVFTVNNSQITLLNNVSKITPLASTIVFVPEADSKGALMYYDGPVVAAFTGRQSYFEKESVTEQLFPSIIAERQEQIGKLHAFLVTCNMHDITSMLRDAIHTANLLTQRPYPCIHSSLRLSAKNMYFYQIK